MAEPSERAKELVNILVLADAINIGALYDLVDQALDEGRREERERIKNRLDLRLNDVLVEMEPGYDDSIVGFNEAWDVMRKVFTDA